MQMLVWLANWMNRTEVTILAEQMERESVDKLTLHY